MSDDEREYSEEEEEEEEEEKDEAQQRRVEQKKAPPPKPVPQEPQKSEAEIVMEEKFRSKKLEEEDSWKEYIEQWRKQRAKEEEELRVLKEKQQKRKAQREMEESARMEKKRHEDEKRQKEMEEKKKKDLEEKKRRLEEAEKKRQAMLQALEAQKQTEVKPNFVIQKRSDGGPGAEVGSSAMGKLMNVAAARGEMGKTKEQLEEDKKISLGFRIKPLEIDGLPVEKLKEEAKKLWEKVCALETEKYDLEERQKRQDYDLKELGERQRQINRNKALKKGLDPDALLGRHPPKLQVASKYERRIDRRTYGDKKGLFDGGFEAQNSAVIEKVWEDRMMAHQEKKGRLPKWLGEQPGKKGAFDDEPAAQEEEMVEEEEEEEE